MSQTEELVMPYQLDRDAVWRKIGSRKALYLDMNVWIDMADGEKAAAQPVKARLQELVRIGKLFCPLNASLIWELYKQTFTQARTGQLMEELSLNVCYAQSREIFNWEVECFAKRIARLEDSRCDRKMLFVPVMGYLASSYTLSYPAGTQREQVIEPGNLIFERTNAFTLTELLALRNNGEMGTYLKAQPATPLQAAAEAMRTITQGDRGKAWRLTEESVFNQFIMPAISKLPLILKPPLLNHVANAPKDKYGGCLPTILPSFPALRNHVEVMTRASRNTSRKDKQSDFYDLEMMPVPLAYADAFVSQDRWVREDFLKPGEFAKINQCRVCYDYDDLERWLDGIA